MVADPTYNPKASVSDELGNPKRQFYHLTKRSFKELTFIKRVQLGYKLTLKRYNVRRYTRAAFKLHLNVRCVVVVISAALHCGIFMPA